MATILVVDDRSTNRQLVVTLLSYGGHRLLEAANGAEALALVRTEHPDLVITDILMPTMDGFEFVQFLRADPALAATKVVFYTATYLVQEANELAAACGVEYVISKPAEPQHIIEIVNAALNVTSAAPSSPTLPSLSSDRHAAPMSYLNDKLAAYLDDLSTVNRELAILNTRGIEFSAQRAQIDQIVQKFGTDLASVQTISLRLTSLIELAADLILERNPRRMLDILCHAASRIIGARYTAIGILADDGRSLRYFVTYGLDAATRAQIGQPALDGEVLGRLIAERQPLRLHEPVVLHTDLPPVHSFLGMPINSMDHLLGFLYFVDSPHLDGFSAEDEWLATTLAAETALLYENTQLYDQIQRHATKLQLEVAERKRIEEQLRHSNQSLQTIIEAAPLAIQTMDTEGNVLFWNSAAESIFGFAHPDGIGRTLPIVSAEDRSLFTRLHQQLLEGKTLIDIEIRPITNDGNRFDASLSIAPLYDEQGNIHGSIAMLVDISERKQREREQKAMLALAAALRMGVSRAQMVPTIIAEVIELFEAAGAMLATRDPITGETVFELAQGKFASMAGMRLAPGEGMSGSVIRTSRLYVTNEAQVDPNLAHLANSSSLQAAAGIPLVVAHGETIGVLWIGREQEIGDGDIRLLTTVADMVANALYRITLYEQNQAQTRQMQQIMNTVAQGLVLLDGEQYIRVMNAAATEHLARLTTAQIGERLTHLGEQPIQSLLAAPDADLLYHEVLIGQPTPAIFEVTATPMQADLGGKAWVLVLRDVTEDRRLQRRALQQDRLVALGELAAGIAHDFNNILTPVLLYTDMTMNRLESESRLHSNLQQVLQATHRAKNLVSQILTFSREAPQARRLVDLQVVCEEVLNLIRAVLPSTIELRQQFVGQTHTILADPTQIHQVLMNLCTNAYHAMRSQGGILTVELDTVTVDATLAAQHTNLEAGEFVRLTISDTGLGMDQDTMDRIFDPFFTTKGVGEGTGMGLAVVYGIVTSYGGFVTVESQRDQGATFQIYLPHLKTLSKVEDQTDRPLVGGTERILVVDDEESIALVSKQILENLGYHVTARTSSVEAIELFRGQADQFDMVVTDLTMPKSTGPEIAQEMLRIRPGLPILLVSGTGEDLTPDLVESFGFCGYLHKPFTPSELGWAVRQALGRE